MSANPASPGSSGALLHATPQADDKELNETDAIPNGQVVHFSCEYG